MRRYVAVAVAITALLFLSAAKCQEDPAGTRCADQGAIQAKSTGTRFECRPEGDHLEWVKTA